MPESRVSHGTKAPYQLPCACVTSRNPKFVSLSHRHQGKHYHPWKTILSVTTPMEPSLDVNSHSPSPCLMSLCSVASRVPFIQDTDHLYQPGFYALPRKCLHFKLLRKYKGCRLFRRKREARARQTWYCQMKLKQ